MALQCETAFSAHTVPATIRTAQCVRNVNNLAPHELLDERFLLVVLDSLSRLQAGEGSGEFPALADANACDAKDAAALANCAVADLAMASDNLEPAKLKALILWMLSEALCP